MEQVVTHLTGSTGLPPSAVQAGIPILAGFLKQHLPPEAAGAVDGALGSHPPVPGMSNVHDIGGLTTIISEKTGVPPAAAGLLVTEATNLLKDRLPPPFNELVGQFLGAGAGGGTTTGGAGGILGAIEGLFGGGSKPTS